MHTTSNPPIENADHRDAPTAGLLEGDQCTEADRHSEEWTKPRALIVRDKDRIRSGLRDALELNGFVVDEADSGAAAIARITHTRPDLLLLDAAPTGTEPERL